MGFDNECILNIQSLAGEYFCPVCRLLVYPNEALQSQRTHLYCKPCLTYIVSTTQACPYDGFLVTEADSKPLVESNNSLAETIGKITVHCLFHRSGCTWQGALSDCTSHCSGCAFGNSPVVCNRCAIQIVHRQVQEHAQNCPGVQPQASSQIEGVPDAAATGAAATGDQTQAVTHAGATTSQGQTQSTAASPLAKDPNQQPSSNSQPQAVVQAAVPTADQWYQQYYQQYPGYNPYQQHYQQYYPYQQQAVPQYQQQHLQVQPQGYTQPQPQVQPPAQSQPQLQPSHPPVQAPVATQPQSQAQVNQQQQSHPLHHAQLLPHPQAYPYSQPQSYPQAPPQSYPQAPPHPPPHPQAQPIQPHPQQMQMPQYQQPQTQMQHTLPQIQQPVPKPQLQSQSHPQAQPQTQVQHHPQPQSQLQLHPSLLNQPQAQHTAANAVTGHHSYAQPQHHQQIPLSGPPQHSMYMHPHAAAQSQMQNQFAQQPPSTRPPQSHAAISNQQQSALLPSPGQVANIPLAQQLPVRPHPHQPRVPVSQHPVVQPVQQPMPHQYVHQQQPFAGQHQQGPFAQKQLPVQSQLRPLGPPHPFHQNPQAYLQPQQNAVMHSMQPHQPQNLGQSTTPNHGLQSQPYQQSVTSLQGRPVQFGANQPPSNKSNLPWINNHVQLSSERQSGVASKPIMFDKQDIAEKSVDEREAESSEETATTDNLDTKTGVQGDAVGTKVPKSETDVKSVVDEIKTKVEEKTNAVDTSAKEFVANLESHAAENAEPVKKMVKEEVIENVEDQKDSAKVDCKREEPSLCKEGSELGAQSEKLQKEKKLPQAQGAPQGPGAVPPAGQVETGRLMQSTPSLGGSSTLQQRPAAPSIFQTPLPGAVNQMQAPGHPSTQFGPSTFKPHGPEIPLGGIPVSGTAASLGRGPGQSVPHQHSFELPSVAPHGPYNQGHLPPHVGANRISHGDSVGGLPVHSLPPAAFPPHGRMIAGGPAYGPEGQIDQKQPSNLMEAKMFASQRPGCMDGRRPESHFPGSLERSPLGQPSIMRMNGVPGPELRDERFKFPDEHLNPFPMDPAQRVIDRGEFEDLKQFSRPSRLDAEPVTKLGSHFPTSRPFDRDPHGFGMDIGSRPFGRGLNYDPGLKMDPIGGSAMSRFLPSYHDEAAGRSDSSHAHLDFPGPGPTYGRRHMDGLSPRSPFRDYPGISSHGFGGLPGILGSSQLEQDDIDGREFRRFGDPIGNSFHDSRFPVLPSHLRRGEFEGPDQDFLPGHLRRGEHLGPHDLRLGETGCFGGFPGHARMGDFGGPGNFSHPRLGEPGFRSSFSRRGFPNHSGIFSGDVEPFDNSRKRKPPSMGWCRICKVDCETVDGLDMHSQTREHQKMAMDMVISIKQNAKKQKLTSTDRGSTDDTIKLRNVNFEGRGKKQ